MVNDDNIEMIREEQWLEVVYGTSSRLANDQWLTKVQKEGSWICEPEELRSKVLAEAGLEKNF